MKETLILKHRGDFDYFLISRTDNSESLLASLNPDEEVFEQKLSKQNCDEIFGVVDVEKLADTHVKEWEWGKIFKDANVNVELLARDNFCMGFNKAMELNKDKVFTLEEAKKIWFAGQKYWETSGESITFEELTEKMLQQPTEIEVEIEMKEDEKIELSYGATSIEESDYILRTQYIKLDSEGCLILKKI